MSDSTDFPQPEDVTSPAKHWSLFKVIYRGDAEEVGSPRDYSIAIGNWDDEPSLAIRWNACAWRPVGNPQSRGLPTWFIVPPALVDAILSTLPEKTQDFTREFIQ